MCTKVDNSDVGKWLWAKNTVFRAWVGLKTFDEEVKRAAGVLIKDFNYNQICIQCLANGNVDLPEDVIQESILHLDLFLKRQEEEKDDKIGII